jgi:L-rhamnose mutarotase
MKRIALTVMLKDDPEVIAQYEQYHANPWPQVTEGLRSVDIKRMYIYRFGRQLFMFMEVPDDFDLERDMPQYMQDPRAREWDELMRTFQETVPGAPEGSKWVDMKEVYAMEHH